jgi:hypothetical protein
VIKSPPRVDRALRTLKRLSEEKWNLSAQERAKLLAISDRTMYRWDANPSAAEPTRDSRDRLSHLLNIYATSVSVFGRELGERWVLARNRDFGDEPPMTRMLKGAFDDIVEVRRYLDIAADGW